MNLKSVGKYADFFMRIVMILTTIIALLYFADVYNQTIFSVIALLTLVALIIKGVASIIKGIADIFKLKGN